MDEQWYYLDPDNRRTPPENGPYCCRCMKKLRVMDGLTWHSVTIHPDISCPWVKADPYGKSLMGSDCWKNVKCNLVTNTNI